MLDTFGPQSVGAPVSNADLQLQLKLTETQSKAAAAAGMGMENDSGKKLIEITGAALSKRKLLVGLDLLCLFLGKYQKHVAKILEICCWLGATVSALFT